MKRNTILSLIALIAAIAGIAAAIILFVNKKRIELLTEFDDDTDDLDEEDIDFNVVLDEEDGGGEDCEDCCADCENCGEDCGQEEIPPETKESVEG